MFQGGNRSRSVENRGKSHRQPHSPPLEIVPKKGKKMRNRANFCDFSEKFKFLWKTERRILSLKMLKTRKKKCSHVPFSKECEKEIGGFPHPGTQGDHIFSKQTEKPEKRCICRNFFGKSDKGLRKISVEKRKKFQHDMVKKKEKPVNYPHSFPQDVENCGKYLGKPSEKPCVTVVKRDQSLKHYFLRFFRDFINSLT